MKRASMTKFYTTGGFLLSLTLAAPLTYGQERCESLLVAEAAKVPVLNSSLLTNLIKKEIQEQLLQFAAAILKVDPATVMGSKKLSPLDVRDLGETGTVPQERAILSALANLSNTGQLRPGIAQILKDLEALPQIGGKPNPLKLLPVAKKEYVLEAAASNIEGVLALRGLTTASVKVKYLEWPELSQKMSERLDQAPQGMEHLLHFAKSRFFSNSSARILIDGPESFALRDRLMSEARKSIDVLTWAVYSDKTGFEAADLLIKKHQEGLKVRVVVDGQVARGTGYSQAVQKMEQAGVEVIRWTSATHPFQGQHRKMILIDGEHLIAGGLNSGDVYSHKNPDPAVARWRDTDVYVQGEAVSEGLRLFANLWNEQVASKKLTYSKMVVPKTLPRNQGSSAEAVALLNHDPSQGPAGSTIMMTLLKGLREAKESVDIENAYVVLFPALKKEIQGAIARGVKVRVLTNSDKSVDEPIVSVPILRSAHELSQAGAEVFLKKGATLHSKLAIIDKEYTLVMSYNLHPRSERVEGEMAVLVKGRAFAESAERAVLADLQPDKATRIQRPEDIQLPSSPQVVPVLRVFFDML